LRRLVRQATGFWRATIIEGYEKYVVGNFFISSFLIYVGNILGFGLILNSKIPAKFFN